VDPNLRVEIQTYDDGGIPWIGPAVVLENVECGKSGIYELSPGSTVVGGREVHQSLTDSGLRNTSATVKESFIQRHTTEDPESAIDSALFGSLVESGEEAWLNRPASEDVGVDCKESEVEVGVDNEVSKDVGVDYEESEVKADVGVDNEVSEDVGVDMKGPKLKKTLEWTTKCPKMLEWTMKSPKLKKVLEWTTRVRS